MLYAAGIMPTPGEQRQATAAPGAVPVGARRLKPASGKRQALGCTRCHEHQVPRTAHPMRWGDPSGCVLKGCCELVGILALNLDGNYCHGGN